MKKFSVKKRLQELDRLINKFSMYSFAEDNKNPQDDMRWHPASDMYAQEKGLGSFERLYPRNELTSEEDLNYFQKRLIEKTNQLQNRVRRNINNMTEEEITKMLSKMTFLLGKE